MGEIHGFLQELKLLGNKLVQIPRQVTTLEKKVSILGGKLERLVLLGSRGPASKEQMYDREVTYTASKN